MKRPTLPRGWWLAAPVMIAAVALPWLLNRPPPDATLPQVSVEAHQAIRETGAPPVVVGGQGEKGGAGGVIEAAPAPVATIADIFAIRTWEPPPPPVDAKPPPPQAPPLPFRFLGRIVEPDKAVAFMLAEGPRVIVVSVGDAIGGNYRIEKYENGQLLFRYRPMNVQQSLAVGNSS